MLRVTIALVLGTVLILSVGCSGQLPEGQPEVERQADRRATEAEKADPGSMDLYAQITTANYAGWSPAPGYDTPQPARGPHGDETKIYLNPDAEEALADGGEKWPVGTIIVKDVYIDGNLAQVAAMRKQEGGWFWGEYQGDGEVLAEGLKEEPCESCHSKGTDGTLGVKLGEK